jgi:hypothetical protein
MKIKPKLTNPKIPSLLAGVAGEYFVAAELSRRGYIASISLRNTRGIDILATNHDASRSITIQCKTNQLGKKSWMLNDKSESFHAKNHFYVFVTLGAPDSRAGYHIVPSLTVAKLAADSHKKWLSTPGMKGQQHVDTNMRKFSDANDEFLERWDLLGL